MEVAFAEGDTKTAASFLSQGKVSNSLICFNGSPPSTLLCTCVLVRTMPKGSGSVNNKSGHLTACHFTATTPTHTPAVCGASNPIYTAWTQKLWHATCSLAFWEERRSGTLKCKPEITQQNRIGYRENDQHKSWKGVGKKEEKKLQWKEKLSKRTFLIESYVNKQAEWWKALMIGIHWFYNEHGTQCAQLPRANSRAIWVSRAMKGSLTMKDHFKELVNNGKPISIMCADG